MSGATVVIVLLVFAIGVSSLAWAGPGVVIAIPICLLLIGGALFSDVSRRRKQRVQMQSFRDQAKSDSVEFSPRDQETLTSSD